jgi:hypothetical protein
MHKKPLLAQLHWLLWTNLWPIASSATLIIVDKSAADCCNGEKGLIVLFPSELKDETLCNGLPRVWEEIRAL